MIYITFQIKPTEYLKGMGYQTKKFAVACEDDIDYFKVGMNLASFEGISYLRVRHSKPHGRIILPATDFEVHHDDVADELVKTYNHIQKGE